MQEGISVLLSSHNMLEIDFLSDRVAIIDKGKILEIGEPELLKQEYSAQNLEEVFRAGTMNKFINLLKKEIKEMITFQIIISLLFTTGLFYFWV